VAAEPFRDSIYIEASPATVFEHFTDPDALASWMGDRAVLDPRPGGQFVVFFEQRAVEGRYIELDPPRRLVITWGRVGSDAFGPGSSTLEVNLRPEGTGTRVEIVHSGLPDEEAPRHALGWRHYLGRLGRVAEGSSVPPHRTPENLTEGVD
jgi:uncharacterized protein YndB with AHSA1/START domain